MGLDEIVYTSSITNIDEVHKYGLAHDLAHEARSLRCNPIQLRHEGYPQIKFGEASLNCFQVIAYTSTITEIDQVHTYGLAHDLAPWSLICNPI